MENINIRQMEQFTKMQIQSLDMMAKLIKYDKEVAENGGLKAENTKNLEAFIDTQNRVLMLFQNLIDKHKSALLKLAEKARLEEEQARKEKEKARKQTAAKEKIIADTKKALSDENSLFNMMKAISMPIEGIEYIDVDESKSDEYIFEECDKDD